MVILPALLVAALWSHAGISINTGKTRVWTQNGVRPEGIEALGDGAWKGDRNLPLQQQGMKVLGTPLGHPEFVKTCLLEVGSNHGKLADIVQKVGDVQCAWLLLLYCVNTRANYYCRTIPPNQSSDFALAHDQKLWQCLGGILNIDTQSTISI